MLNLLCHHGMVMKHLGTGRCYVVLAPHKWATLSWPVWEMCDSRQLQLDASAQAEWIFMFKPDMWNCQVCEPTWTAELGICLQSTGPPEPLLKTSLRSPKNFVFNDLVILVQHFGLHSAPAKTTRKKLLQLLAEFAASGDEEFGQEVMASDTKPKLATTDESAQDLLVECLLENLGLEERSEYRELQKKSSSARKATAKKQQWAQWHMEKLLEMKEPWMLTFFHVTCEVFECYFECHWLMLDSCPLHVLVANQCSLQAKKKKSKGKGKGTVPGKARGKGRGKAGRGKKRRESQGSAASLKKQRLEEAEPEDFADASPVKSEDNDAHDEAAALEALQPGALDTAHAEPPLQVEPDLPAVAAADEQVPPAMPLEADPQRVEAEPAALALDSAAAAASSSSNLGDDHVPLAALAAAPSSSSQPVVRASSSRVHKTPSEILDCITPPGFAFRLSYNDRRFKVECNAHALHESVWTFPYTRKTYSKSFCSNIITWREALADVHDHGWKKWALVSAHYPVANPPTPGHIDEEVHAQLEPVVQDMPPPKKY